MTSDELLTRLKALYGSDLSINQLAIKFAGDLEYKPNQIHRWLSGDYPIRKVVIMGLENLERKANEPR